MGALIRLRSRRAPFRRAGVIFASTRANVDLPIAEVTEAQLRAWLDDPAINVQVVHPGETELVEDVARFSDFELLPFGLADRASLARTPEDMRFETAPSVALAEHPPGWPLAPVARPADASDPRGVLLSGPSAGAATTLEVETNVGTIVAPIDASPPDAQPLLTEVVQTPVARVPADALDPEGLAFAPADGVEPLTVLTDILPSDHAAPEAGRGTDFPLPDVATTGIGVTDVSGPAANATLAVAEVEAAVDAADAAEPGAAPLEARETAYPELDGRKGGRKRGQS